MKLESTKTEKVTIDAARIRIKNVEIDFDKGHLHIWFRALSEDGERLAYEGLYRPIDGIDGRFRQALKGLEHEARLYLFETGTVVEEGELEGEENGNQETVSQSA